MSDQPIIPPEEKYKQPGAFDHQRKNWFAMHHFLGYSFLIIVLAAIVFGAYYWQVVSQIPSTFDAPIHKAQKVKAALDSSGKVYGYDSKTDPTIEGVDANKNGIRDDIDAYLAQTYPDQAKVRTALLFIASTQRKLIINSDGSPELLSAIWTESDSDLNCLLDISGDVNMKMYFDALQKQILNTDLRIKVYEKAAQYKPKQSQTMDPSYLKFSSCKFDPTQLPN
jgi:hypothetical protein